MNRLLKNPSLNTKVRHFLDMKGIVAVGAVAALLLVLFLRGDEDANASMALTLERPASEEQVRALREELAELRSVVKEARDENVALSEAAPKRVRFADTAEVAPQDRQSSADRNQTVALSAEDAEALVGLINNFDEDTAEELGRHNRELLERMTASRDEESLKKFLYEKNPLWDLGVASADVPDWAWSEEQRQEIRREKEMELLFPSLYKHEGRKKPTKCPETEVLLWSLDWARENDKLTAELDLPWLKKIP